MKATFNQHLTRILHHRRQLSNLLGNSLIPVDPPGSRSSEPNNPSANPAEDNNSNSNTNSNSNPNPNDNNNTNPTTNNNSNGNTNNNSDGNPNANTNSNRHGNTNTNTNPNGNTNTNPNGNTNSNSNSNGNTNTNTNANGNTNNSNGNNTPTPNEKSGNLTTGSNDPKNNTNTNPQPSPSSSPPLPAATTLPTSTDPTGASQKALNNSISPLPILSPSLPSDPLSAPLLQSSSSSLPPSLIPGHPTTRTATTSTTLPSPSPLAAQPSNPQPSVSSYTTTISVAPNRPSPSPFQPKPPTSPVTQNDQSSGISSGAITAIAIIAGIVGFILLFWVGVQVLQGKRRKRREAQAQEIDFDPSGNGSVMGDNPLQQALGVNRNSAIIGGDKSKYPNLSNSPPDHCEPYYSYDHSGAYGQTEYIEPRSPTDPTGQLHRQMTTGSTSVYSNSSGPAGAYYSDRRQPPGGTFTNFAPHPAQYGPPPHSNVYDSSNPLPPIPQAYEYGGYARYANEASQPNEYLR
ncbi:hypothetical protein O181_078646 [Austropuccinia psidii MF-1]|uniref:Uncharacterized protein n=1 Tax=Austropuccinia psidii MF-1 TaxID=1389203 RepID=A0A9Q3ID86_9BASI|nr:hypothetical protein [Austropuccinia psidii MF-1]